MLRLLKTGGGGGGVSSTLRLASGFIQVKASRSSPEHAYLLVGFAA